MDTTLLTRHKGDYLAGSFFKSGADGHFETSDPATGVALDRVPYRVGAVDEALADARASANAWGAARAERRFDILRRMRDVLEARRGALAAMLSREMGKTTWEANLECVASVRAVELLIEQAREILAETPHPTARGSLRRRPLGVVAAITPFPYPIYGPIQQIVPCLLAGNTVVWNPSRRIPLTSQRLVDVFDSARIPSGVLSLVQGPRDPIGHALLDHPDVDMVVAAGSAETARAIRARTASDQVWAQGGGKGWAIVCEDADLDRAAYEVVTGAFLTTGQRCNATSRVLVEKKVAREFLRRVVGLTNGLQVGPPTGVECFAGPLVDNPARLAFAEAIRKYVDAGISFPVDGAELLPAALKRRGQCYVAPAIALVEGDLPRGVPAPEDVIGPLLVARLVDDAEQAAEAYNRHRYGLSAAVFTESELRFAGIAGMLEAGAVNWNRGTIVASARYPNAGLRESGLGAEGNAELIRRSTWPQATLGANAPFNPAHRVPGMGWPSVMGVIDPSSMTTPPYRPDDDTEILPPDVLPSPRKA